MENGTDFSKIVFSEIDPEELERIYVEHHFTDLQLNDKPQGIEINQTIVNQESISRESNSLEIKNHPASMIVQVSHIHFHHDPPTQPIFLRFSFRGKETKTPPLKDMSNLTSIQNEYPLTYHSIMFDVLKIDLYQESGILGTSKSIGRVRIKLSSLPSSYGEVVEQYEVYPKRHLTRTPHSSSSISTPSSSRNMLPSLERNFSNDHHHHMSSDKDSKATLTVRFFFIPGQHAFQTMGDKSYNDYVPLETYESISSSDDTATSYTGSFSSIGRREPFDITSHTRFHTFSSSSTGMINDSMYHSSISRTRLSSNTSTYSTISDGISTKYSRSKGSLVSERTKFGWKELMDFAKSFFKNGWPISKMDLFRSISLINKYFDSYFQQPRTNHVIQDVKFIQEARYWLKYTIAAYGTFVINWSGFGNGYLADTMKSDKKAAIKTLELHSEDMLAWEIGQDEMFKPHFFICRDRRNNAIVVSIRGTWSLTDALTDLCAEYEPFLNGYVHRGFLRCAKWIDDHYMNKIIESVVAYKCEKLFIVGHSLGGAIAPILTMIVDETVLPILKEKLPNFVLSCWTFAAPPSVSLNIAEAHSEYIHTFINENDLVPRMSTGVMTDFKEILVRGADIAKAPCCLMDKLEAIDLLIKKQKESSDNPKIYIPGTVYYMYKSTRAKSKFLNDISEPSPTPAKSAYYPNIDTTLLTPLSDDASWKRETFSSPKEYKMPPTSSPHPLIDFSYPHYVLEKTDRNFFTHLCLKSHMIAHHFPDRHDKAFVKVIGL